MVPAGPVSVQVDLTGKGFPGAPGSLGAASVECTFTLRPKPLPKSKGTAASVAGAGVGEVGGAHWFAAQHPPEGSSVAAGGSSTAAPGDVAAALADHEGTAASEGAGAPAADKDRVPGVQGGTQGQGRAGQSVTESDKTEGEVRVRVVYGFHSSGLITTDWEIDTREALPASLAPGLHK
jgi:hypothetical protein